jgi:DNA repair exonuclease SbcCD nuclease subunit
MQVTFVHAADLHLDAPFAGIGEADEEISRRLREATFGAFERVVAIALEEQADFLVLAGDIFNSTDRSLRAQVRFAAGLKRLAESGIATFIAHGNHDPLSGWSPALEWPPLTRRFDGREVGSGLVEREGQPACRVYGLSFPQEKVTDNLAQRFSADAKDAPFAVGVLHASVGTHPDHATYAQCSVDDLRAPGFDYWALGHVHTRQVLRAADPCIVYPGNTQGLTPNETGPRGCTVVTLEEGAEPQLRSQPTAVAEWRQEALSIADLETEQALVAAADGLIERLRDEATSDLVLLRLRVEGSGPLHGAIHRRDLEDTLRDLGKAAQPTVWTESVADRTRPALDLDAYAAGDDFTAEFLRAAGRARDDPALLAALREGELGALLEAAQGVGAETAGDEELARWVERARVECAERLIREREAR